MAVCLPIYSSNATRFLDSAHQAATAVCRQQSETSIVEVIYQMLYELTINSCCASRRGLRRMVQNVYYCMRIHEITVYIRHHQDHSSHQLRISCRVPRAQGHLFIARRHRHETLTCASDSSASSTTRGSLLSPVGYGWGGRSTASRPSDLSGKQEESSCGMRNTLRTVVEKEA